LGFIHYFSIFCFFVSGGKMYAIQLRWIAWSFAKGETTVFIVIFSLGKTTDFYYNALCLAKLQPCPCYFYWAYIFNANKRSFFLCYYLGEKSFFFAGLILYVFPDFLYSF